MLPGIVLLNGKISEDLQVLNRKISKDCHSLGGDSSFFLFSFFSFSFFSGKNGIFRRQRGSHALSPVYAVGCCQHPVPLDEGPSAGVVPAASGVILEGDLGGNSTG